MSDNLAKKLAAHGKPVVFCFPDKGDFLSPTVAAINAARETGWAQLAVPACFEAKRDNDAVAMHARNELRLQDVLAGVSLHQGELVAVLHRSPTGERDTGIIDVICTDHPSQRNRKPAPLTEDEMRDEIERRR